MVTTISSCYRSIFNEPTDKMTNTRTHTHHDEHRYLSLINQPYMVCGVAWHGMVWCGVVFMVTCICSILTRNAIYVV